MILCNCARTWADVPEVALVSTAESDEPLSAQILHNRGARAVSGKKSQHHAFDLLEPTIWEWEEAQRPHLAAKCPTEDNFISSQVSKQHIFSERGRRGPVDRGHDRAKYNKDVSIFGWRVTKWASVLAADNDEVGSDTPNMYRAAS